MTTMLIHLHWMSLLLMLMFSNIIPHVDAAIYQNFTSKLPIVVIDTHGQPIDSKENKVFGDMKLIYNNAPPNRYTGESRRIKERKTNMGDLCLFFVCFFVFITFLCSSFRHHFSSQILFQTMLKVILERLQSN
jgi:hypothetical protein